MELTVEQAQDMFQMGRSAVLEVFRSKGSPAYRIGVGNKAPWRCNDEEMRKFMKQRSERFKG